MKTLTLICYKPNREIEKRTFEIDYDSENLDFAIRQLKALRIKNKNWGIVAQDENNLEYSLRELEKALEEWEDEEEGAIIAKYEIKHSKMEYQWKILEDTLQSALDRCCETCDYPTLCEELCERENNGNTNRDWCKIWLYANLRADEMEDNWD